MKTLKKLKMGGHVNMMDDVLISNLSPELLRSSLRTLVSQGAVNQQPFVQHVRQRFTESPPALTPASRLFPEANVVSPKCQDYLRVTRCVFSCKLAHESLDYLAHFLNAITSARASWNDDSDLFAALERFGGDVVQAVQALKESKPEASSELKELLSRLITSLTECREYCRSAGLSYPFTRADRQVQDVCHFLYPDFAPASSGDDDRPSDPIVLPPSQTGKLETCKLGPIEVPRLFNGFWQLSSPAWGSGTAEKQESALAGLVASGLVAVDMADHYGDAELVYGAFRRKLSGPVRETVFAATKWCIFGPINVPVTRAWVLAAVKERSRRLGGRVELLQFHWYDYEAKEYLDILAHLVAISNETPELVTAIGLCNFDSEHVEEACQYLLGKTGEVGLVSNQVQFSLLDSRPIHKMSEMCARYGLKLLTYGTFCGGLLSEKWLGQPIPEIYAESSQLTPSQRKYLDVIHNWGAWSDFQELMSVIADVAGKHGVSLTNVATRWVLQQPSVGAVIVGTRLGVTAHGNENLSVFEFRLSADEMRDINHIALGRDRARSRAIFDRLGDCGNEYRAMH
ncbi:aldo-keto reductase [Xylariomycetidae sp. FL2044]|nr:aldo-keto reductase [Xylariomycetidae sp. FL2044]